MAMDERKMILEMLKDGKITVDEAERLMDAAGAENQLTNNNTSMTQYNGNVISPKRLRIIVTEDERQKVNVRIPFSLVRAGLNIAKVIGPRYSEEARVLEDIDIDEILESLSDGTIELPYTIIDVDDEKDHVMIVLE